MKDPQGKVVRIGAGGAFAGDRVDAPRILVERGDLDYVVFDAQSEGSFAAAARRKSQGGIGYDINLERRIRGVLPACVEHSTKMIMNAGGADVLGAIDCIRATCADLGIKDLTIGYVLPSDITDLIKQLDPIVSETGARLSELPVPIVGAQAYQSAAPIAEALAAGADIVVTSKTGDSAQYLGALAYEFGWDFDNVTEIGPGLGIGHLLECGSMVSGGAFHDGEYHLVPHLENIGYPIAEVSADGSCIITKPEDTGGVVSEMTVKQMLVYEIADPADYRHTDATIDFTNVAVEQVGENRVKVTGFRGLPRPENIKVTLGATEGYVAVGRVGYGGTGAYRRAQQAAEIIVYRMEHVHGIDPSALHVDFMGVNALYPWPDVDPDKAMEVFLRIAGHFDTAESARELILEMPQLAGRGPAGIAHGLHLDATSGPDEIVGLYTTFIPRDLVEYDLHVDPL